MLIAIDQHKPTINQHDCLWLLVIDKLFMMVMLIHLHQRDPVTRRLASAPPLPSGSRSPLPRRDQPEKVLTDIGFSLN